MLCSSSVFLNDPATTAIYTYLHTLSLHDALPILRPRQGRASAALQRRRRAAPGVAVRLRPPHRRHRHLRAAARGRGAGRGQQAHRHILKKAGDDVPATVDPTLLQEPAEAALAEAVEAGYAATGHALAQGDSVEALAHLARLRPRV